MKVLPFSNKTFRKILKNADQSPISTLSSPEVDQSAIKELNDFFRSYNALYKLFSNQEYTLRKLIEKLSDLKPALAINPTKIILTETGKIAEVLEPLATFYPPLKDVFPNSESPDDTQNFKENVLKICPNVRSGLTNYIFAFNEFYSTEQRISVSDDNVRRNLGEWEILFKNHFMFLSTLGACSLYELFTTKKAANEAKKKDGKSPEKIVLPVFELEIDVRGRSMWTGEKAVTINIGEIKRSFSARKEALSQLNIRTRYIKTALEFINKDIKISRTAEFFFEENPNESEISQFMSRSPSLQSLVIKDTHLDDLR